MILILICPKSRKKNKTAIEYHSAFAIYFSFSRFYINFLRICAAGMAQLS